MSTINTRAVGITVALTAVASTLIYKFGDLLELLFTPEVAADIVRVSIELVAIFIIALATIGIGWVTTKLFRELWLEPDPKLGWKPHRKRLMACSFVWTFIGNFIALCLRYVYEAPPREVIELLLWIGGWTILVAGASMPLYDVIVKRLWPRLIAHYIPGMKLVQTPTGLDARDQGEPSGDEEHTVVTGKPREAEPEPEPPQS